MKKFIVHILFLLCAFAVYSQATNTPNDEFYRDLYDRYRILNGSNPENIHTSFKPISRNQAHELLNQLDSMKFSGIDAFNGMTLTADNWLAADSLTDLREPIMGIFYRKRSDFYHTDNENFRLRLNPVLHLGGGTDGVTENSLFINTRGVEVSGLIDNKVGFYSYIGENQARLANYVRNFKDSVGALPGEGFVKGFKEGGYDFFHIRGYVDFNATKHINVQIGRDRFRIGQGMRSVLLSDFAVPYFFLKLQTRVWKINYTNLFTQLTQDNKVTPAGSYPPKFMSLHHLSINLGKKFNIGFFESIVYGTNDSTRATFQVRYLNPIIFYRGLEHQDGSSGNVQIGMDAEWLPFRGVSVYGQFLLDEFKLEHVLAGEGWWANKYGMVIGSKYLNAFTIPQLDLNLEYSQVRPYTYSHHTQYGSYTHFRQNLAHPRGANFREFIADVSYQPFTRLFLNGRYIWGESGTDDGNQNWGSDPYLLNSDRVQENGNEIGQGILTHSNYLSVQASYMLMHNLFFDLQYITRSLQNENGLDEQLGIFQAGLRYNISNRKFEF